jgi:hypothetical protein
VQCAGKPIVAAVFHFAEILSKDEDAPPLNLIIVIFTIIPVMLWISGATSLQPFDTNY